MLKQNVSKNIIEKSLQDMYKKRLGKISKQYITSILLKYISHVPLYDGEKLSCQIIRKLTT